MIHDGLNSYTMRNGRMERVEPEHSSFGLDGQRVYDYHRSTGVLKINGDFFPPNTLEEMTRAIRSSPDKSIDFEIGVPILGTTLLTGIKVVEHLRGLETNMDNEIGEGLVRENRGELDHIEETVDQNVQKGIRGYLGKGKQ